MKIKRKLMKLLRNHSSLMVLLVSILFSGTVIMSTVDETKEDVMNLAHTAADLIDGDTALEYAAKQEKDEAYLETEEKLKALKLNFRKCVYMYVYAPINDEDTIYLYDVYNDIDNVPEDERGYLGYVEKWDLNPIGYEIYQTGGEVKKIDFSPFSPYGSLFSYTAPVYDSYGRVTALVGIDYSFLDFVLFIIYLLVGVIFLVIVITIILNRYEMKQIDTVIIQPIELIEKKTLAFAQSEHNGHSQEYMIENITESENELDRLALGINKMMADIDEYIQNIASITKERERISAELDMATRIQASALPNIFPAFPDRKEFDIYATMTPAKEVGGDFYDFFFVDEDHLCLVMADVSGKGVGAALFMMVSKILINNQAFNTISPAEILRIVNKRLCARNEAEMFVTVWLGMLEISTGIMKCANAGHEYPAIMRKDGRFELFKDKHGFVLGGMDMVKYKEYEIQMNPGDTIFVYTDGVAEATDANNELFGTERMLNALNSETDCGCVKLLGNVHKAIDSFVGDAPQFDDITMMAVYYAGTEKAD